MANVTVAGASYSDVPAVILPKTGGGSATFVEGETVTVTQSLTHASSSSNLTKVLKGDSFYAEISPDTNYRLASVTVTMGGIDITDQVFKPGLGEKAVTANGTYTAAADNLSGYSKVVVNVAGGGGDTYIRTEICPQQTVTPDSSQRRATLSGLTEGFVDGDYYIVTYDGVEWMTTCETLWSSNYCIGEAQLFLGVVDSVYPFGIIWMSGTTATVAAANASQHTVKVEHLEFIANGVSLIPKSINANGTYTAASDNADGFSVVSVDVSGGGSPSLQTKTKSYTPTKSVQTEAVSADSGYDGLDTVNISVAAIPSQYIVPEGTKSITANGTGIDVTAFASVDVSVSGTSKNAQVVQGTTRTTSSTMTAIGAEMTVAKTGTYDVYWSAFRSNTSTQYTFATQLYIAGTAYGSEQTTWSNHQQNVHLSNVSLTANQKIRVYGRESRGSSYYMYAGTLTIIEA